MKDHDFWRLIQRARKAHQQAAAARTERCLTRLPTTSRSLVNELSRLIMDHPLAQLIQFQERLCDIHRRTHRSEVCTAFGIAIGGVDEFDFEACISWLILQGKRTYGSVLLNPDLIGEMPITREEVSDASGLSTVVREVLEPDPYDEDAELIEARIDELISDPELIRLPLADTRIDLVQLRRQYPRLTVRFLPGDQLPEEPFVRSILPETRGAA